MPKNPPPEFDVVSPPSKSNISDTPNMTEKSSALFPVPDAEDRDPVTMSSIMEGILSMGCAPDVEDVEPDTSDFDGGAGANAPSLFVLESQSCGSSFGGTSSDLSVAAPAPCVDAWLADGVFVDELRACLRVLSFLGIGADGDSCA